MPFWEELAKISNPARKVPFLGDRIGTAIENWTNPLTQVSGRNPMLEATHGDFDWSTLGSKQDPTSEEENINNMNVALATLYGTGMGASALYGAAGSGGAGAVSEAGPGSYGANELATWEAGPQAANGFGQMDAAGNAPVATGPGTDFQKLMNLNNQSQQNQQSKGPEPEDLEARDTFSFNL